MSVKLGQAQPVLLRIPFSHYCRKVEWAMTHVGVSYDAINIPIWKMRHMERANPQGTVPVLVADQIMTDSQEIMSWLNEQEPMYPSEAVYAWENEVDEFLGPASRREAYRVAHHHPMQMAVAWPIRVLLLLAKGLTLKVLKYYKARRMEATDPAEIKEWIAKIAIQLDGKPYLFGESPTAADFATAALAWPILYTLQVRDYASEPHWPEVSSFMHRVRPKATTLRKSRGVRQKDWQWFEADDQVMTSITSE